MSKKTMEMRRFLPLVLLTYSIGAWLSIELFNNLGGGYIQHWYAEYYINRLPSGSMKWRTEDGKLFANFALLIGMWVYPFCVVASVLYAQLALSSQGWKRLAAMVGVMLCLMILGRFLHLGVFTAVAPE